MERPPLPQRPRILLVDDSFQLRTTIADALTALGNHVTEAHDGLHALELFSPGAFDVVLTDFAMPAPNGLQLAERIRERAPEQRIVLVSGYADALPDDKPSVVDLLLRKPIALTDLSAVVSLMARTPAARG